MIYNASKSFWLQRIEPMPEQQRSFACVDFRVCEYYTSLEFSIFSLTRKTSLWDSVWFSTRYDAGKGYSVNVGRCARTICKRDVSRIRSRIT